MATAAPFNGFDFTKIMADFKVPAMDVEKLMAAQKKNFAPIAKYVPKYSHTYLPDPTRRAG